MVDGGVKAEFLIDSGANESVIMEDMGSRLSGTLLPHEQIIMCAWEHRSKVMGDVVVNPAKRDGTDTIALLSVVVKGRELIC